MLKLRNSNLYFQFNFLLGLVEILLLQVYFLHHVGVPLVLTLLTSLVALLVRTKREADQGGSKFLPESHVSGPVLAPPHDGCTA